MYTKKESTTSWNQINEYFKVSEKGCISFADNAPFHGKGRPYLTAEMVEYIVANLQSLQTALSHAKAKSKENGLSKEVNKLVAHFIAAGMEQQIAVDQAIAILKKRAA